MKQLEKDYVASGQPASAVTFGGLYGYMTADLMIAAFKKAISENELTGVGIHSIMEKGFTFTSPLEGGYSYKYPFMFNAPDDCAVGGVCRGHRVSNQGSPGVLHQVSEGEIVRPLS